MNYCIDCGNEMKETAKFCPNCGSHSGGQTGNQAPVQKANMNESVEKTQTEQSKAQQTGTVVIDTAAVQDGFFSYVYFLKDTLIAPTSVFYKGVWINGLISIILCSILLAFNVQESFFAEFVEVMMVQMAFVGILFILNKFLFKGTDSFLDSLAKYGGLVNTQIVLLVAILLLGIESGLGALLLVTLGLNQINILNLYICKSQEGKAGKIDNYYQTILSYIAFGILLYISYSIAYS